MVDEPLTSLSEVFLEENLKINKWGKNPSNKNKNEAKKLESEQNLLTVHRQIQSHYNHHICCLLMV